MYGMPGLGIVSALFAGLFLAGPVAAQGPTVGEWKPDRAVRVLIGSAPGSGADITLRTIVPHMAEFAKATMVVENVVGAGGAISIAAAARSQPDGHTLLGAISGIALVPLVNSKATYDLDRDLAPISQLNRASAILVVNNELPSRSLREFIDLVKASPGKFDMGNFGFGSSSHLQGMMLAKRAGLEMQMVPFQGGPPLLRDIVAGHICCGIIDIGSARAFLSKSALRPLAVSGSARSSVLPDVPTFSEQGITGLEQDLWQGLFAPAKTPGHILNFWSRAMAYAVKQPDVIQAMTLVGSVPVGSTPAEFTKFMDDQISRWKRLVDETGVRIQ